MRLRGSFFAAAVLFGMLVSAPARAELQGSVAVRLGAGAAIDRPNENLPRWGLDLGVHGDLLFGARHWRAARFGPYLDVSTLAFGSLEAGGGVTALLPTSEMTALALSPGAFFRLMRDGAAGAGAQFQVAWGLRSFNYHSNYGPAAGLYVMARQGFGDIRATEVLFGIQADAIGIAMPFMLLYQALR